MRTLWGWRDKWYDTALQTQNSKFEPWRSQTDHATSRSRRPPTILSTSERGKTICFFEDWMPERGSNSRSPNFQAGSFHHCTRAPPNSLNHQHVSKYQQMCELKIDLCPELSRAQNFFYFCQVTKYRRLQIGHLEKSEAKSLRENGCLVPVVQPDSIPSDKDALTQTPTHTHTSPFSEHLRGSLRKTNSPDTIKCTHRSEPFRALGQSRQRVCFFSLFLRAVYLPLKLRETPAPRRPRKHQVWSQWCFNVGPASQTLGQH